MHASKYTDTDVYYGPAQKSGTHTLTGATGQVEIPHCTGYLESVAFNITAAVTLDVAVINEAVEGLYVKTGVATSTPVVRPRIVLQKNTDGTDLTVYGRVWLQDETVYVAVENATIADVVVATLTLLPN